MSKKSVQTNLFGEALSKNEYIDSINHEEKNDDASSNTGDVTEFKKIDIDDFVGEHKCPRCGFEWND